MSDLGSSRPRAPFRLVRLWPLALLAVAALAVFAFRLDRYVGFDALRTHRADLVAFVAAHATAAAVLFVLAYAAVTALSIPGATVMTLVGGFLFGTLLGGTLVTVGATVGATVVFLAAKSSLGDYLLARAGPAVKKMEVGFRANALSYMLFLRLVPAFPFFVVNLVPAFLGVSLKIFVIATAVGILPATFIYASVGSSLGVLLDAGATPDLGFILEPQFLLPIVGLALLALVPVVYKRWRSRDR